MDDCITKKAHPCRSTTAAQKVTRALEEGVSPRDKRRELAKKVDKETGFSFTLRNY